MKSPNVGIHCVDGLNVVFITICSSEFHKHFLLLLRYLDEIQLCEHSEGYIISDQD